MAIKKQITFEGHTYNLDERDRVAAEAALMSELTTIVTTAEATYTLTAEDSGKTILLTPNASALVLPSPSVGLTFKVIQSGAYATAASTIKTATTDNSVFFVGGYASGDSSDANNSDNNSNDVITFGSATLAGDFVEITCITATTWAVSGFAQSGHNSNGIVFSDA